MAEGNDLKALFNGANGVVLLNVHIQKSFCDPHQSVVNGTYDLYTVAETTEARTEAFRAVGVQPYWLYQSCPENKISLTGLSKYSFKATPAQTDYCIIEPDEDGRSAESELVTTLKQRERGAAIIVAGACVDQAVRSLIDADFKVCVLSDASPNQSTDPKAFKKDQQALKAAGAIMASSTEALRLLLEAKRDQEHLSRACAL